MTFAEIMAMATKGPFKVVRSPLPTRELMIVADGPIKPCIADLNEIEPDDLGCGCGGNPLANGMMLSNAERFYREREELRKSLEWSLRYDNAESAKDLIGRIEAADARAAKEFADGT